MNRRVLLPTIALIAGRVLGQDMTMGRVSFEVASIKPTGEINGRRPIRFAVSPSGQLTVANMPLRWLIANAYNVPYQSLRLSGGPEWIHTESYDMQAIAPGMFSPGISAREREARTRVMLRALLAERFGLVVRHEEREMSAYVLVPAKRGAKLTRATVEEKDCPTQPADDGLYCHHFAGGGGDGLRGPAVDMGDLALYAENWLDRPVIDGTGIQGLYRVETPGWASLTPSAGGEASERPSVFSVFEETLGLRLEGKKAKVEVLVIEKVGRPTVN